jgi:hypothetical protein
VDRKAGYVSEVHGEEKSPTGAFGAPSEFRATTLALPAVPAALSLLHNAGNSASPPACHDPSGRCVKQGLG